MNELRSSPTERFLRGIFSGSAFALAAGLTLVSAQPAHAADRPNIVLILADDVGFSDIGCYGSEIPTPNLDKLASTGVRFTQFYNNARCCPSRASLLSGLYSHQAGIGHMMGGPDKYIGYADGLTSDAVTLAEVLKTAGYNTLMTGKWHVTRYAGPNGPKFDWPMQRGFEKFYGIIGGFCSYYDPVTLCRGNTYISPAADPEYQPKDFFFTNAITDNSIKFLEQHRRDNPNKPYFLYAAYTAAHFPLQARPEDIAKFKGKYDNGYDPVRKQRIKRLIDLGIISKDLVPAPTIGNWSDQKHKEWEARCMEVYAAMVYRMDQEIGKLIDNIRQAGELDNTLVMFISDNGGCPEDVGRQPSGPYASYQPMKPTDIQHKVWPPMQTRDGRPVKTGWDVMPGPPDSFIGYGENWANVSDTPLRLYKHYVHEGGISSPCIIHWPQGIKASKNGTLIKEPGHIVDVMATFADVANTTYPETYRGHKLQPLQGISLLPALAGKPLNRQDALYFEHENNRAVRLGKWKLVALDNHPWELYNIDRDRGEMNNLARKHPAMVKKLSGMWNQWAATHRVLPLGAWKQDGTGPEPNTTQTVFQLKAGDVLKRSEGPVIGGRKFTITANISHWADDGIIISHGDARNGYALFAMNGKCYFLMRWKHEYVRVETEEPLTSGPHTIVASIGEEGRMTLKVDGQIEARRRPPGFILHTPEHELRIGNDKNGLVDPKMKNHPFQGKIKDVQIKTEAAKIPEKKKGVISDK